MNWPTFQPYFSALVKLLQGPVFSDDEKYWSLVLNHRAEIEEYFYKIGLILIVVEQDEFAYLANIPREDAPDGYRDMPKLTRAKRLSFPATVLCLILKKEYTQHQENVGAFEPPTITADELFDQYQAFPSVKRNDEWRGRQQFETQLKKLISEQRVLRDSGLDEGTYRILPSINSLITSEFLAQTKELKLGGKAEKASEDVELD